VANKTLYLVDTNVLREFGATGNAAVGAWLSTIDDDQLRISPVVYREMRQGCESERRRCLAVGKDISKVEKALAALDRFETDYADRQIPITLEIERVVASMLGAKGKNERDVIIAATAKLHDLVVVTRNRRDFVGRGVRILNPFKSPPIIECV